MRKIKIIIISLILIFVLVGCNSKNAKEDFRITSDWSMSEKGQFVVEGIASNISNNDKKDVVFEFKLTMKDGKEFYLGDLKYDDLKAGSQEKYQLDFTDKLKDTDYKISDFKNFNIDVK